jgi:SPP1 gp7 family putative phage head morphogenesis protein
MSLIDRIFNPSRFRESVVKSLSDDQVRLEYVNRHQARAGGSTKTLSTQIKGNALLFTPKTISDWNSALQTATDPDTPNLQYLAELYNNLLLDSHTRAVMETRVMRVTRSKIKVVDANGNENEDLTKLLQRPWFADFCKAVVMHQFTGVKVLELAELDEALELKKIVDIPMAHLIPKKGMIARELGDTTGFDYRKGGIARYYLQIGEDNEIGELSNLAPLILAKKLSMGSWLNYVEKYGVDPRVAYTNNYTKEREDLLYDALINLKSHDVMVLREGERVEALESTDRDAYQIYKELIAIINDELSKAILGQAGTVDAKEKTGTFGSMSVMQEVSEDRHETDRMLVQHVINKQLFPQLALISSAYSAFATHSVVWDDSEELSPNQVGTLAVQLAQAGFELDTDELSERLGITITGYRSAMPGVVPGKNSPNAIAAEIAAYYEAQGIGSSATEPQAADLKKWRAVVLAIARQLYDGTIKASDLNEDLIMLIYAELDGAALDGLGDDYDLEDEDVPDDKKATARRVRNNVYRFSAAKTYAQQVELTARLLDENGQLRSWAEFKKEAEKVNETFNRNYLQAEFQTARRSAQAIRQWESFQENADLFPNLEYRTVGDSRVRDDHDALEGTVKPLNDAFWDKWYPPNGFRCRCSVRQTDKAVTGGTVTINPDKGFSQHVGKTLKPFDDAHPVFVNLPREVSDDIDDKWNKLNEE